MQPLVFEIPLNERFRGEVSRSGVLLFGDGGWAEFAPFGNYDDEACVPWLRAAVAHARGGLPSPEGELIPVNVTIPAVTADEAYRLASGPHGCTTAKVKVAEWRLSEPDDVRDAGVRADLARLEATRAALGPGGKLRIDVNQAWDVEFAQRWLPVYDRAAGGLEYAEQPVPGAEGLAGLRRLVSVPLAADEAIRLADDPLAVRRLDAADVAVLKVHPLGGLEAALRLADDLAMPTVVSSAIDTSVGLRAGLALAAALPDLPYACGLGTATLLATDVTPDPLLPRSGHVANRPVSVDLTNERWLAGAETAARWAERLDRVAALAGVEVRDLMDYPDEGDWA